MLTKEEEEVEEVVVVSALSLLLFLRRCLLCEWYGLPRRANSGQAIETAVP